MILDQDFLLSATNPIANRGQASAEEAALRILKRPEYKAARDKARFLWRLGYGEHASAEALETFESAMDEYAFNYLLKATASDGNYPRFVRDFMPAHAWFSRKLPGARMGGDNPDNCYRVAGITHGARYEVCGKVVGQHAVNVTFTLVANYGTSVTIQTLDFADVKRAADGPSRSRISRSPNAPPTA
jgi:hypothetical protein